MKTPQTPHNSSQSSQRSSQISRSSSQTPHNSSQTPPTLQTPQNPSELDYTAVLTGEPFLFSETRIMAEYILRGDYSVAELKKKNLTENLIRYKTPKAILRVNTPIFKRLAALDHPDLLTAFVNSDVTTSKMLLLCAIMKTDRLVRDFIEDLYFEKIILRQDFVEKYEINNWFEQKIARSPKLSKVSEKTQYKLKQVMTKIMKDAGLYLETGDHYQINLILLSDTLKNLLMNSGNVEYYKLLGGKIS